MVRYGKRSAGRRWAGRRRDDSQLLSRRMIQLVICLALFATVYVSKGIFPYKIQRLGENITTLVGTTTDLSGAFTTLGEALSEGESVVDEIGNFCVEVFGGSTAPSDAVAALEVAQQPIEVEEKWQDTAADIGDEITQEQDQWQTAVLESVVESSAYAESLTTRATQDEPAIMAVGEVYLAANDNSESLPAGYTCDMLSLGGMERTTPVMGVVSSDFGYRLHPISGQSAIHNGLDIVAEIGSPIYAFGSGTVEYVGESDIYGLYFRIDHGNGVSSFYAHCNAIYVQKGDGVSVGDVVATVGATGEVTGAHLHFELRCYDVLIDPAYYIDTL